MLKSDEIEEINKWFGFEDFDGGDANYIYEANYGDLQISVLMQAVEEGNVEIVSHLIKAGADVNFLCETTQRTPLFFMDDSLNNTPNKLEIASLLISNGADINFISKNDFGDGMVGQSSFLSLATSFLNIDLVKLIIDNGAKLNIEFNPWGETMMFHPVIQKKWNQFIEISDLLIFNGANINTEYGILLKYYVAGDQYLQANKLISLGAKTEIKPPEPNYDEFKGKTALMVFLYNNGFSKIKESENKKFFFKLWNRLKNINAQDDDGKSILFYAIDEPVIGDNDFYMTIFNLIVSNDKLDFNLQDSSGNTALNYLISYLTKEETIDKNTNYSDFISEESYHMLQTLIPKTDISIQNNDGETPKQFLDSVNVNYNNFETDCCIICNSIKIDDPHISFNANVSTTALITERTKIEFSVNEEGDNFKPPSFEGFKTVVGPNQSTKLSFINGKRTYTKTYTYILTPKKRGFLTIEKSSILVKGVFYYTQPIYFYITAVKQFGAANDLGDLFEFKQYLLNQKTDEGVNLTNEVHKLNHVKTPKYLASEIIYLLNKEHVHKGCLEKIKFQKTDLDLIINSREKYISKLQNEILNLNSFLIKLKNIFDQTSKARIKRLNTELNDLIEDVENQKKDRELILLGYKKKLHHIYSYWLERPPDWQHRRLEILAVQNYCVKCGEFEDTLHIHHKRPISEGGDHTLSNLEVLCEECHSKEHGGISFEDINQFKVIESAFSKKYRLLREAVELHRQVKFKYYKYSGEMSKRTISPESFKKVGKSLCVEGFCSLRESNRVFNISRMNNLTLL